MKYLIQKYLLLISAILIISGNLYSKPETEQFYFNKIAAFSSLSSFYVKTMVQDSTGYIWIATSDGMNRYDGHEIKVYKAYDGKENLGLVSGTIQELLLDSKDRLWVGTPIGISLYNKELDKFEIIASITEENGLESFDIKNIFEDKEGNIYVGTGVLIYRYDEEDEVFKKIFTVRQESISRILFDKENGGFWVGYLEGGGIDYYASFDSTEPKYTINVRESQTGIFNMVNFHGQIWAALGEEGAIVFDAESGTNIKRKFNKSGERNHVINFRIDKKERLWLMDFSGIKRYRPETKDYKEYYTYQDLHYSLQPNTVDIFEDNQGNFYTLHNGGGVYVSLLEVGFDLINTSDTFFWHLNNPNISAIAQDKDDNLWLGSFNGGIDIFKWKENKIEHISQNDESLEGGTVTFIYKDSKDNIWTSTYLHGLKKYNNQTKKFKTWKKGGSNSLAHNDIRSICEDDKGNFWVGTHGGGLDYLDIKNNSFKNYNQDDNNLTSLWINHLLLDSQKRLWVATSFGVSMLQEGDTIFTQYFSNYEMEIGIKGDEVSCILEDDDGKLWVGTNEGLYYYSEEHSNFILYDKLPVMYITSLQFDVIGDLWIGTHDGLYRLDLEKEVYNIFDDYDGLQGKDFNLRASYSDADGRLYFGGTEGLSMFYPERLVYNDIPPMLRFSRLLLFNEPIEKYGEKSVLPKEINYVDELVLEYKQNFFTIEFTALNYTNPLKTEYACKMEGFDDDWINIGNKRSMSYTNLFPGKYTFRVKAANNHGVWNEEGISLKIIIKPPWYLSKWFIILVILMFSMLLMLIHKLRIRTLRVRELQLTNIVQERTTQLKESNAQLQQRADELKNINYVLEERQNTIISQSELLRNQAKSLHESNVELKQLVNTRDKLLSIIAHDLRSPFNTILGFTGLLTDAFDASNPERMKQYARYIHDASISVFNLLENLLYWARSQTEKIDVKPDYYFLDNIVEETLLLVKESAAKKSLTIDDSGYNNYKVFMDVDMMNSVFRNLIINAIKFTPQNGKITITTEQKKNFVEVKIQDTGVGMSKELIESLYKRLKVTSKPGTLGEKGVGIGLALSYEFIIKNGGELKIDSKIGKGTSFVFTIPLNP